ncbi:MAG: hypothetical protein HUJ26_24535 [Planctomycetaceae bacterium]|nr:hypothetical protein [Planctomycetaceae bacterium]
MMKGINPKEFLMKHGEKFAFGFIVLMALFVLKSTRWSPYDKTPQELVKQAKESDQRIDSSTWPVEKRQELMPKKDILARAKAMREGIDYQQYSFSTAMYTPIYPRSEPIREPSFLTIEDPIATADTFLLQIPEEPEEGEEEVADAGDTEPEIDDSNIPDALKKNPRATASSSEFGEYSDPGAAFGGPAGLPGGGGGEGYAAEFGADGYMSEFGEMGGETQKVSLNGEGYRFVSVRGVIDWQTQKSKYVDALNLPPDQAAFVEPDIVDFEIERRKAVGGDKGWSNWEVLDIQNSIDVLNKAYDLEADTVDVTITDPVITEPLPRRVLGIWGKHATHPRVTNFELSPEEQRREQLRQEKVIEAYEEMKKNSGVIEPIQEGGFGNYTYNVRGMQNEMRMGMGGNADYMSRYENEYQEEMSDRYSESPELYGSGQPGEGGLLMTSRSKASGRLLLFRYFDFDVEPGAVYQYRVRIHYANPNFGKPIEVLERPEIAEDRIKQSDWSVPTKPVQVRPKSEYFLTTVDYDRARRQEMADVNIFQWNAPTGTVVNETIRVSTGDKIAGTIKTKVVNPLEETFEAQEMKVDSDHVLVDLKDNGAIQADSQLEGLGKIPSRALYDEILVLDSHGQLATLSPYDNEAKRIASQRFQKFQDEIGKEYEKAAKEASEADKFLMGDGGEYGGGEGYGGGGGYGAPPSSAASRRGSSRGRRRGGEGY